MQATPGAEPNAEQGATRRLVVRNALYLTVSQAVTVPLSVLTNALTARYLGAESFGYIYLAGTFTGFGMLAVNWGHEGVLPALVAQDHSLAGRLLGSSFAWRAALAVFVYVFVAALCHAFGYGWELQWALALTFIGAVMTSLVGACKDTIRGFERADIPAIVHVAQQLLGALLIVPVLLLGGRMRATLTIAVLTAAIALVWIWRSLSTVGVGRLSVDRGALKSLFTGGTPFVFYGLAMVLQPNIDAIFMSKLASLEAVGWYAVARRLVGVLLFPVAALVGALYPTLCRLWVTDQEEFKSMARGSLHSVALLAIPIAMGCGLYPDIGIAIFSRKTFGPAADDLRVLALFLFLVYFTMPLGICILAAGKQRAWSIVQSLCVGVSLALDPLLTPWFQRRFGNGGLGPCVASVASEVVVVAFGLALTPKGIIDARLRRSLLFALLSGILMALVARLTTNITPYVAAPLAVMAYACGLWLTGEINRSHLAKVRDVVLRKFSRSR